MRNREEDRARWNAPEFNKWLDEAISDAGHSVWDAIPDIGSAWNDWDACKSATGYYCPACNGSGEELHLTGAGPDAYEILGDCHACEGDGRASVALAVAQRRITELCDSDAATMGHLFLLDRLKAENEALRKESERLKFIRENWFQFNDCTKTLWPPAYKLGDGFNAIVDSEIEISKEKSK